MKPMKVTPVFQVWPTPPNYRKANPRLPAKIRIFKIQKTSSFPNSNSKPEGNVSQASDFKGVNNSEILVYGVSTDTKGPDAAIARHGNFLQWGYSASPSKMTREGLKLFLNSLVYIKKFDGKRP